MSYKNTKSDLTIWLDNAGRFPVLPPERINSIAKQIQALPEDSKKRRKLVNTLVQHNLRLVPNFVHGFMSRCSHNKWGSHETVDYLQVGVIGLVRAAEKFDPTRGYTFATYATFWIRSKVSKYNMKTLSAVTVSESASRQLIFYKRNGYLNHRNGSGRVSEAQIRELEYTTSAAYKCVSLNVTNESGHELMSVVPDRKQSNSIDVFAVEADNAMTLAGISEIGKEILFSSIIQDQSMKQIGQRLGISVARVKNEKDKAIRMARARPSVFKSGMM